MAGTHLDITARKQAEEELRQYRENLETLVEERTCQLNETQRQLINQAMESGRAQLAAMVLHNIGNAFTPVNVYVYQLKDDGLERISRHLDHCMAELNRHHFELQRYVLEDPRGGQVFSYLGDLVQALGPVLSQRRAVTRKIDEAIAHISEILTLQHAYAAGEHELKELVSLNSLVEDAVRMQAGALEKRGIRTVSDLDPALPRLLIDKSRLIQVIVNFIKNSYEAIDALNGSSEDRWIALRSSCRAAAVVLEIEDNGAGIEPELMDRLFDFGRSSKGSSGFGLYYCRMFVEANGGTLGLSSPGRGKGAAVRVVLPLRGGLGQLESRSVSEP
jgi:signal transduction histidine kinase